jgi:hypothetical protein
VGIKQAFSLIHQQINKSHEDIRFTRHIPIFVPIVMEGEEEKSRSEGRSKYSLLEGNLLQN